MGHESRRLVLQVQGEVRRGWATLDPLRDSCVPSAFDSICTGRRLARVALTKVHLYILARGVIGNTPGFDPGIPSSSLGGPVYCR
jgi:hypothetical protein